MFARHTSALLSVLALATIARANTTLLSDDFGSSRRKKIDAGSDLDAQLDAIVGSSGFSTDELNRIEDRLRQELRSLRPRAMPKLVLYVYPGQVTLGKLKDMQEVWVDVEITTEPCDRTFCDESMARLIEIVGRAVQKSEVAGNRFRLVFKNVVLQTVTPIHDQEVATIDLSIEQCIDAAKHFGGGSQILEALHKAAENYRPLMVKAVAKQASTRRVGLRAPPSVDASKESVTVRLRVAGSRSRKESELVDALAAAATALAQNKLSPLDRHIEIEIADERQRPERYRCLGQPVVDFLDGKINRDVLFSNYIEHVDTSKNITRFSFDDDK